MGLISKTVMVKWHVKSRNHYESLGYVYTKLGDEFEVNIEHLTNGSKVEVVCECDGCGKKLEWKYGSYNRFVKSDGKTYCNICGRNLVNKGEASFKTFYDWCVENHKQCILNRWDYELNNCSPKDITFSTSKKYYFKCDKHPEHKSEIKRISDLTTGGVSIACKQCSSIAQYILDNFPDKDLYDVWDKDKNEGASPWEISRGNKSKKYWFICQEKDYHGSYEMVCNSFSNGRRCPCCTGKRIHPKDSLGQYIIDKHGEDFLWNIWSDKNEKSPFEYAPKSGISVWWKCSNNKHENYLRKCESSFNFEFRCPKCVEEMNTSIIEEKTKSYLKEIGYDTLNEHNCTIRPINPKTKMPMPYDNEIILDNGKHLIIEVNGEQHYTKRFYKTMLNISDKKAEEMLKQRKLYDRYKKAYAEHHGYFYLEIPYTSFVGKNKDNYKQMIDNKISEILHYNN